MDLAGSSGLLTVRLTYTSSPFSLLALTMITNIFFAALRLCPIKNQFGSMFDEMRLKACAKAGRKNKIYEIFAAAALRCFFYALLKGSHRKVIFSNGSTIKAFTTPPST